ncbi:MAG: nitrite/sulfite reductase, partial [Elusimicrobia bacterium]|nr:nitrite/sulfite reductase [Elusimicrobiota bacterium]
METKAKPEPITPGAQSEISQYRQDIEDVRGEIEKLYAGKVSEDDFKKYRLQRGIYGQKQKPNIQMVRVKIPWGRLTATQLETLADIADEFSGGDRVGIAHVTTRQDIQFHFVPLEKITDCMSRLADVGLTTREACANTVRNVTADPLAGVATDEIFDISPYAEAAARFFLRHPICQNLPRKFKIAFSGSPADRGLIPMHDLGCLAQTRSDQNRNILGFKISVGGGLGSYPKVAQVLEDFTPVENLLRTIHAVLFVFNRDWDYGRKYRNLARIKFLLEKIGVEEFRKRVFAERENLKNETYPDLLPYEETQPAVYGPFLVETTTPEYSRWKSTNVQPQKQS